VEEQVVHAAERVQFENILENKLSCLHQENDANEAVEEAEVVNKQSEDTEA